VELLVSDDGRGFDPDPAATQSLGLGLGIMRERAQAIGASFDVDSQPGRGTRVCLLWTGDGDVPLNA
jgi:two-component system nitrate/nitrite sensor histidine kinase NarX